MAGTEKTIRFRVRYSDTDQMGTFSSDRVLDWFERGRTALLRHVGIPYVEVERRGVFLPVAEAHVKYLGRARYDDELEMTTTAAMQGKARLRCDCRIVQAGDGRAVATGYTIHAFVDASGKPVRPPAWFLEHLDQTE
ncbi:MAG: acyl-CoA thioesterase [Planctomycetota bacterium]|jgi:acyl-CoA thioester hydrolase